MFKVVNCKGACTLSSQLVIYHSTSPTSPYQLEGLAYFSHNVYSWVSLSDQSNMLSFFILTEFLSLTGQLKK